MEKAEEPVRNPARGLIFSLASGVLACIAGTFGKFAFNSSEMLWFCETICSSSQFIDLKLEDAYSLCGQIVFYLQVLAFGVMVLVNILMWTVFVKALHFCHTSLEATVTNTAANFISSAIVGRLVFGESMSLMWWFGTLLILFGLALMNYSKKGGGNLSIFRSKRKKLKSK